MSTISVIAIILGIILGIVVAGMIAGISYDRIYTKGYNDALEKECKPILIAKEVSKYNYNETFNCVNFTTVYLDELSKAGFQGVRLSLDIDNYSRHALACVLIEPQTGKFISKTNSTIWSPCSCMS